MHTADRGFFKRLTGDEGYALAMALGAIVLVSLIAASSYTLSQKTLEQASTTALSNRAYQVAASAIEYETALFESGLTPVSQTNKTLPSGDKYDLEYTKVSDNTLRLKSTARSGGETEKVSVLYSVFDFSETIYSGSGNIFGGSAFNSPDSKIIGAFYLKLAKAEKVNSSMSFIDGPLYVENGEINPKGGVDWVNTPNYTKYRIYADITPSGLPGNVEVMPLDVRLTPPSITPEMIARLKTAAKTAGTYYDSSTTVGLAGDKFNQTSNGVFTANSVIFVEGTATIAPAISSYKGRFTIFATDMIIMRGRLVPQDYATNPSNPPTGTFDSYYSSYIGNKVDQLPQARIDYCAALISPGPVNLAWSSGNNSTSMFGFCGAVYSGATIAFQESLRGAIIGKGALDPNKKTILATQISMRDAMPTEIQELFTRAIGKSDWMRSR